MTKLVRNQVTWTADAIAETEMQVHSPIFFIGFPRSGTTVAFEGFSRHPLLGWPSSYSERFPAVPAVDVVRRLLDNSIVSLVGKKGQYGRPTIGNRLLPQPNEAYSFWDLHTRVDFSRSFLRNSPADADKANRARNAVRRLLRWQGRSRFAAKFTGPPRIAYLNSVFPNSYFVHVVRDGRAAVHSLLRVAFWREKGGLDGPFWKGGLSESQERRWRESGQDPGVLAALQWTAVLDAARSEGGQLATGRYCEIRYEDFVQAPHTVLRNLYEFCGLEDAREGHRYLEKHATLADMNQKYRHDFSAAYIDVLTSLMQPGLASLNYPN